MKKLIKHILKEAISTKEMEDFAEGRGKGAEKITDNAKEKGGNSMLTYHHFKVKLPYYEKAAKGKFDMDKFREEYEKLQKERINAFKEFHDDAINKKFNDPKITVGIKDSEYEIFLELAEKI